MDKDTRIFFPNCAPYDRVGMEKFLEKKAREGWMLESIEKANWRFRKTEPRELRFSVSWFPDAPTYDTGFTDQQRNYIDLCLHSGWKLISHNDQLHIFYTDDPNVTPIETDPELEVQTIHKAMKKQRLFLWIAWVIIGLMRFVLLSVRVSKTLVEILVRPTDLILDLGFVVLAVFYLAKLIRYFRWYRKARRVAREEKRFLSLGKRGGLVKLLPVLCLPCFLLLPFLVAGTGRQIVFWLFVLVAALATVTILAQIVFAIKDAFAPRWKKKTWLTTVTTGVLLVVAIIAIPALMILQPETELPESPAITCRHPGNFHEVYHDELPLYVEDLTGQEKSEDYSAYRTLKTSRLASRYQAEHIFCLENTSLEYTIVEVWPSVLYEPCLRQYLKEGMRPVESAQVPGVQAIYQLYSGGIPQGQYVLQCDGRIISLSSSWLLTQEQLQKAAEILGSCPLPNT